MLEDVVEVDDVKRVGLEITLHSGEVVVVDGDVADPLHFFVGRNIEAEQFPFGVLKLKLDQRMASTTTKVENFFYRGVGRDEFLCRNSVRAWWTNRMIYTLHCAQNGAVRKNVVRVIWRVVFRVVLGELFHRGLWVHVDESTVSAGDERKDGLVESGVPVVAVEEFVGFGTTTNVAGNCFHTINGLRAR